jgi:hypothetical protein
MYLMDRHEIEAMCTVYIYVDIEMHYCSYYTVQSYKINYNLFFN